MAKISDLCVTFGVGFRDYSKVCNLFRPVIFFLHRSCPCGSDGTSFIRFGGQVVENGRREVWKINFSGRGGCRRNNDFSMSRESKPEYQNHHRDTAGVFPRVPRG